MIIKRLFLLFIYCFFNFRSECVPADLEGRSVFLRTINGHTFDCEESREKVRYFLTQPFTPSDEFCLSMHTFISDVLFNFKDPSDYIGDFPSFIAEITGLSYEDFLEIDLYTRRFSEEYSLNPDGELIRDGHYRDSIDLWAIAGCLMNVKKRSKDHIDFLNNIQFLIDLFNKPENPEIPQGKKLIYTSRHSDVMSALGYAITLEDWPHKLPYLGDLMRKWPQAHDCGYEPIIDILAKIDSLSTGSFVESVLRFTQGSRDLEDVQLLSKIWDIYRKQDGAESWESLISGVERILPQTLDLLEEEDVLDRTKVLEGLDFLGRNSSLSTFLEKFLPFLNPNMNANDRICLFAEIHNFDLKCGLQDSSNRFFYLDLLSSFVFPDSSPEEKGFFFSNLDIWARDSGQDTSAFHGFYRYLKKSTDPLVASDGNFKRLETLIKLSSSELHAFIGLFPEEIEGEDLEVMLKTLDPQGIFDKEDPEDSKEHLILLLKSVEKSQRVKFVKCLGRVTRGAGDNSETYLIAQHLKEQASASWEAISASFDFFWSSREEVNFSLKHAIKFRIVEKLGSLTAPHRQQLLEGILPFLEEINSVGKMSIFQGFFHVPSDKFLEAVSYAHHTLDRSWPKENKMFFLKNIDRFIKYPMGAKLLPYMQKTESFLFCEKLNIDVLGKFCQLPLETQKSFLTFFTPDMTPANLRLILNLLTQNSPVGELVLITKRAEFQVRHLTSLNRRMESIQKAFDKVEGIASLDMRRIKAAGPEPLADLTAEPISIAEGFRHLADQINVSAPDQPNYLHVSAVGDRSPENPEESEILMRRAIGRFLFAMEVMEGKKETPNSDAFWEPHAEDKPLILNSLKHILRALQTKAQENFEEALPYLGILVRAFNFCPTAQAEGVESLVNVLIYGENCASTELSSLLKIPVARSVHKAVVNEFFEGGNQQNIHQLAMARDALRDHLPSRVLSSFSDKSSPVTPEDSQKILKRFALALTEDVLIQEVRESILPPEYHLWQKEREELEGKQEKNPDDKEKLQEIKRRQALCQKEHPITVTDIAAWLLAQGKEPNNMEEEDYGFRDYGIDSNHTAISDEGIRFLLIDFGYIKGEPRSAHLFQESPDQKRLRFETE